MELLISAGRVLTGPGGELVDDGAVLVGNGAIVAVGTRDEVERLAPDGVRRVSFPEGTVLPGLIDCHVHLAFDASPDPVTAVRDADDASLLLGMAGRAQQLLATGVTTVRDLGDRGALSVRLRDAIAAGVLRGPRIMAATAPLTSPGGHCWFLGGEVSGEEAIREQVRRNVESGADVIKVMATGGGITPGGPATWQSQFTTEELQLVVTEAGRAGLPVAAHAHGADGIASAVAAGVNTIEHCTWMVEGGFEMRDEVVTDLAAKEIHVCPAASPNWRGFAERFGRERAEEVFARVRWMAERGVRLVAGTDAGVPNAVFDGFVSSLEFYEYLGFPRDRVIDMATIDAARALGIDTETGQLAAGYRADLLVVDGDPLRDLNALRAIRLVLAGGRPCGNGKGESW
ncbi:imidazolonepropionase-like amidohydrolase [Streptomyces sp. 1114.5]|uniref:amidohydrolase family protein n=1 Tax=unclassified Streptomyces TaxID=2593676 RepID=UPI000BCAD029|nr:MULTISPECIES: amidohydrolase family protein [unclassified Streptomyces]RKT11335.1 imidazolonepropionase-like amidohydrolase [Streptomyces sp. 1114.5]SOB81327.1 Imidazolonepropionase [Streptomyces sp. 1331.2]